MEAVQCAPFAVALMLCSAQSVPTLFSRNMFNLVDIGATLCAGTPMLSRFFMESSRPSHVCDACARFPTDHEKNFRQNRDSFLEKEMWKATEEVDACCNPASGEVIPAPFRLSGFLLCNIPIVATMLFVKSVPVQVCLCVLFGTDSIVKSSSRTV